MNTIWTRAKIIRHILEHESQGTPLSISGKGVDHLLYSASRRIFGSWRNAILAAGIPPQRILTWERWTPAKILVQIRLLSRRSRPLTTVQMNRRYSNLVSTARRCFGSWSKAVLAAGVDPLSLQRVIPWNEQRIIEAILTRTLRGESLVAGLIEPRSLAAAACRFFGSWRSAVVAAGLDPTVTKATSRHKTCVSPPHSPQEHRGIAYRVWSRERIVECIQARARENRPMNAHAIVHDFPSLYAAANRHLNGWDEAMRAAGLDPDSYRRKQPTTSPDKLLPPSVSQVRNTLRPNENG